MKKILKVLKKFTHPKSSRIELRYVYYDAYEKKLVAGDNDSVIVVGYDLDLEDNLLINVNNENNNNKPVAIIGNYLAYKEEDVGGFPDYESVLIAKGNLTKRITGKLSFAECLLNAGAITGEPIVVKFNKEYSKLHLPQENTRIHYNNPKEAFMLSGLVDFGNKNKKRIILPTKLVIASVFKQNIW